MHATVKMHTAQIQIVVQRGRGRGASRFCGLHAACTSAGEEQAKLRDRENSPGLRMVVTMVSKPRVPNRPVMAQALVSNNLLHGQLLEKGVRFEARMRVEDPGSSMGTGWKVGKRADCCHARTAQIHARRPAELALNQHPAPEVAQDHETCHVWAAAAHPNCLPREHSIDDPARASSFDHPSSH